MLAFVSSSALDRRDRAAITLQHGVGRLLSPLWVPAVAAVQHFGMDWRIENARDVRAEYRRIRSESSLPLLICANHLTMVDSGIVAWALGSPAWYLWDYSALPWNMPESRNFTSTPWSRFLVYVMKCIPITRGGNRDGVGRSLARVIWLLRNGETALIFPEGGRSRTGRVDTEAVTWGAGRILHALGRCRVLCVYLRGTRQETFGWTPARGERFRVYLDCFEPRSEKKGLRGSIDLTRQIVARLAALEERYFAERA